MKELRGRKEHSQTMMSGRAFPAEQRVGTKAQRLESPGGPCEPRVVQHGGRERVHGEEDGKRNHKGEKRDAEGLKHKAKESELSRW